MRRQASAAPKTATNTLNFVWSHGSRLKATPRQAQRTDDASVFSNTHDAAHATRRAPGNSGKIIHAWGMNGTVNPDATHVSTAAWRPAMDSARSNIASAVSAAMKAINATTP